MLEPSPLTQSVKLVRIEQRDKSYFVVIEEHPPSDLGLPPTGKYAHPIKHDIGPFVNSDQADEASTKINQRYNGVYGTPVITEVEIAEIRNENGLPA